ncbi:MAG TPA: methyl-accepting chemotaxis protein, partial [Thermodesulforhabdus norvegica]|nr:methyl-accepting chemotaxis protein [Thermodesulforhabdus norvegica]
IVALSHNLNVQRFVRELQTYHDLLGFGDKETFDISQDIIGYREIVRKYEKSLKTYTQTHGYQDLFIICPKHGHVMYSVAEKPDLGTNLAYGPYKNEGLAKLWKKVMKTKTVVIEDFTPYSPRQGQQVAFIGAPVFDKRHTLIGVIALQISVAPINDILQKRAGLGKTGETFLVAEHDGKIEYRSDQTLRGGKVGKLVKERHVRNLFSKATETEISVDANNSGELEVVICRRLKVAGLNWKIFSIMSYEEFMTVELEDKKEDFYSYYAKQYGYHDLFLIHPDGTVFYTVAHNPDYKTNIIKGKYSNTNLGKLINQVISSRSFGFADFEAYAPSNNEPASFIALPLVENNNVVMVIALRIPLEGINRIMQLRSGMGKTGEAYLVGPDKLMRSDSYLDPINHSVKASFASPEKGQVNTEAVREALSGKSGCKVILDYRGQPVLSAYTQVKVGQTTWALLAEIDKAEAFAAVKRLKQISLIVMAIGLLLVIGTAILLSRSIVKPLSIITNNLEESAEQVTGASGEVSSMSQQLAEGASEQAASIEEISSSVEEMASMTRQNAENALEADGLMKEVVQTAEDAKDAMNRLLASMQAITKSSEETQKIIKVIDEIAFQTNLLALNAAVEAARAGEAGTGFAVVADEVRSLAMRATEAAKNTADLIHHTTKQVQEGSELTQATDDAFSKVHSNLTKVVELVNEIAAASREQAEGIDQISKATGEMDKTVQQTAANAEEFASVAEELNAQAVQLRHLVNNLTNVIGGSINEQKALSTGDTDRKALPLQPRKAISTSD